MNYLAHAYLSFGQPQILVGNMISDFVKGRKKFDFSEDVQKGISLHRSIDEFTDRHPATIEAKEYFRSNYRLYSSAFVDVVYDHFLACDPDIFPNAEALRLFSSQTYQVLEMNFDILPPRFQNFFPWMKQQDWLFNYQYALGIEKSFGGLQRRAKYIEESSTAFEIFIRDHALLKDCYNNFFPDVKNFAKQQLNDLLKQ